MKPIDKSFKIFNVDRTKNEKVTWFTLLELEINEYTEKINIVVNYPSDTFSYVWCHIVLPFIKSKSKKRKKKIEELE